MSHYQPYPNYKDSGIDWLGQVPEHWAVIPIKRVASLKNFRTNESSSELQYVGLEDVQSASGKYMPTEGNARQSEDSTVGVFSKGDVLYGKLRPYLKKAIVAEMDGVCSTEFLVLDTQKVEPELLQKWLLTSDVTQQIESTCEGAKMPRADWEGVGSVPIPVPPNEEQSRLVEVINTETARIENLIAKKTRFIELLKEKRQALITHAVTKGLNPDVPMKDSGIEWIGEVPEHWATPPIKYIVSTPVTDGPHETPEFLDAGVPFISAEAVSGGEINFDKKRGFISYEANETYSKKYSPQKYDIYMVKSGATTGVTAIVETEELFNIWSPLAVIRCKQEVSNPYFILNSMKSTSFQKAVEFGWSYGTQQNIGMGVIENLRVALPPLDEQNLIVEKIDTDVGRINSLIDKTQHSIELLKERRSAFITAAVTGQIDLREAS